MIETSATGTAAVRGPRIDTLDGLRGVAALVVVIHHTLLVVPRLADPYRTVTKVPIGSTVWWAVYSPLHVVWGGGEAVYVFFVISGFVLARPFLPLRRPSYTPYYAKRIVRLYVPTLGALVVAGLVRLLVAREPFDGASWWLLERNVPVSARGVLNDAILLFNPGTLTGVLWSLRWEVLFSLMLPFFVALAQLTARTQAWLVGVLISFVMLGSQLVSLPSDLFFLPMFGLGVLLASREAALRRAGTHRMMVRPLWWLATAAAISLLMAKWFLVWISVGWSSAQRTRIAVAGNLTSALGSGLLVVLALVSPSLAVLARRPVLWLGSRSFSLYLVHEPIVVSAAYLAEGWNPLSAAVGIAISLIVAEVFYRVVERRSIVFAARAASRANQALESATPA